MIYKSKMAHLKGAIHRGRDLDLKRATADGVHWRHQHTEHLTSLVTKTHMDPFYRLG